MTTSPVTSSISLKEDEYGIDPYIKNLLKQIILTVIILLILATSVILVKYMFYHKYSQKMLKILIGPRSMVGWNEKWDDPNCVNLKTGDKPSSGKNANTPSTSNSAVDKALDAAGVK